MRFSGAGGRLGVFGQRQRSAQFEAARALLLLRRRCRGSGKPSPGGRGIGGIAREQDFCLAPDAAPPRMRGFPRRSDVASASSRTARARSGSPARASASANAIFKSPLNHRTFCSRSNSTPRRMSSSPPAGRAVARSRPTWCRNTPNARHRGRSCSRASRASSRVFARRARPVAAH